MATITQTDKMRFVLANNKLRKLYFTELEKTETKKMGIQKVILTQKNIASNIYDNH